MAIRADFSGIVVHLAPVAGEAEGPSIGLGPLGTLGVAIRTLRVVHVGIVRIGGRGRMAGRALGAGGMMRFMAFCAVGLCPLASLGVAGVARESGVACVREGQVSRLRRIPYRKRDGNRLRA